MKRLLILGTTFALSTFGLLMAQTKPKGLTPQPNQTDSALTAEIRRVFMSVSKNTIAAARSMPESAYSFRPSPDVRTFGGLIAHIASVQSTLCGNMNGDKAVKTPPKQAKADLIEALSASMGACDGSFAELSAENVNQMVDTPSGKMTHLAALVYIISHGSEEYGHLSIYLRLNKIAPPTSDDAKGAL